MPCIEKRQNADVSFDPAMAISPTTFPPLPLQLVTDTASSGGSPGFLVSVFQKLYGSQAHPNIVRYNDFSDIAAYFVQKVRSIFL